MQDFESFSLLNTESAKEYAVAKLGFFPKEEALSCTEIGDGNINYVFQVRSLRSGRSLILKQADRLLRSSGRPLDIRRSHIEAEALKAEGRLAPGQVPRVFDYDGTMAVIAMEDISSYQNLRRQLASGIVYPHLAESLSSFLADTLLPSTDLVLDRAEKKKRAGFFINPELCDITEDLVLTEPYDNYKNRNIISPGNEDFVEKALYQDSALHTEAGKLRDRFMNLSQALLHGDLHTGSIFTNEAGIKVIDPEFAFYGPMGYDIGNVIGNLFFALAYHVFCTGRREIAGQIEAQLAGTFDLTFQKLQAKYDALVNFPLYREEGFKRDYIERVMADTLGYAGTEIIRRVVGDAKVMELSSMDDLGLRLPMERALILLGKKLIMERPHIKQGKDITAVFYALLS